MGGLHVSGQDPTMAVLAILVKGAEFVMIPMTGCKIRMVVIEVILRRW